LKQLTEMEGRIAQEAERRQRRSLGYDRNHANRHDYTGRCSHQA
jgi:hypothetical protein